MVKTGIKRKRIEEISRISDKDVSGFTKKFLGKRDMENRPFKKYQDEQFLYWRMLELSLKIENKEQVAKWGVQQHTLPEWIMYTTEELGELAKAISEFVYREGDLNKIYKEAIQVATLALKIAEMTEIQR